ncbi:DNA glycosylase [Lentinula boryana]|uniref:Endonuclease III homolog n=1 Tax=Lentinula boryana TaxID=40481 RepID=A0ABQ8QBJ0_9AGAR|nr:DNA glycosylase [Lentinula boryana]
MLNLTSRTSTFNDSVTLFELKREPDEPNGHEPEPSESNRMCGSSPLRRKLVRNLAESESEEEQARPPKRSKRVDEPYFPSRLSPKPRSETNSPSRNGSSSRIKTKPSEPKSPRKLKRTSSDSASSAAHPAPPNWRQVYDLIHEMRYTPSGCAWDAAVDTMGCSIAGEGEGEDGEDKNKRFSILISLMLSSQTKDVVTHAAISNLRSALRALGSPGLSAIALASAPPSLVQDSINKVGFWRRKTEYIQKAAVICRDKYDGDIPKTLEELLDLPGVGKKMAYLTLGSAWGLNMGIGVDVHVHRITNRLGWHNPPTKTPEETSFPPIPCPPVSINPSGFPIIPLLSYFHLTLFNQRINLESWLPRELHQTINHLLVGFGQTICSPVKPKCSECSLSSIEGLCPSMQLPSQTTKAAVKAMKKTTNSKSKATTSRSVAVESKNGNLDSATTTNSTLTLTAAKIDWVEGVAGTSEEHVNKSGNRGKESGKAHPDRSGPAEQGTIVNEKLQEETAVIERNGGPQVKIEIEQS